MGIELDFAETQFSDRGFNIPILEATDDSALLQETVDSPYKFILKMNDI